MPSPRWGRHLRNVRGRHGAPIGGTCASSTTHTAMIDYRRLRRDLTALGLLALAVFAGLSMLSYDPADPPSRVVFPAHQDATNTCGAAGAYLAYGLHNACGLGAYFLLFTLVAVDVHFFFQREMHRPYFRAFGLTLFCAAICISLQLVVPSLGGGQAIGSGGLVGAMGAAVLTDHVAPTGIFILMASTAIAGILLTHDLLFFGPLWRFGLATAKSVRHGTSAWRRVVPSTESIKTALRSRADSESCETPNDASVAAELPVAEQDEKEDESSDAREPIKVNPPITAKSAREELMERLEASSRSPAGGTYQLPPLDLLDDAEDFPYETLAEKAQIAAVTLEKTFKEFGLNVRVVEIDTGPVITQYELELEAGLRLSKVTSLADDLAIALRVSSVRVVAPIPGKNTVGVEVPNENQVMVRLRELIESCPDEVESNRIPVFLGKDVSGRPHVVDLTRMPHLLIAGRTGTGKSVCLNSLILSVLMTRSPDQVKMLLIDPKMVELSPYKRIPHLMHPVITDMQKAEAVLAWAVDKMEERYDLLARCGVRHLDGYNKLGRPEILKRLGIDPLDEEAEQIPEQMPYILIVADEMADLMMSAGKDVEAHIIRLAQKSRAVGIHLVLATQKPTVDVITGLIKSNLPARISFQVASRSDSRVVLDEIGADRLLGNGDMLYLAPGTSTVTRAQGTFVSDDEVNDIIEFFGDHDPEYCVELAQLTTAKTSTGEGSDAPRQRDDLYDRAVEVIVREGRGSVSLLQRHLGIGYGRAARLIDYMAEDGIVGDYNGSQAREVLYTMDQWEALQHEEEPEAALV